MTLNANCVGTHAHDRYSKLSFILEKMERIVRDSSMAFNQKRIHRECKAASTMDKIFELNLIRPEDEAVSKSINSENATLILPESDEEYNELISYLTYELNAKLLQTYDLSSDEETVSDSLITDEIIQQRAKSSQKSIKHTNKQVLSRENFQKYFFDIEYKIKMELKAIEMDRDVKSRGNSLINTEDCKLSCFSTSRGASSKYKFSTTTKSAFDFDGIKSFFVEDSKADDIKRYSHICTNAPDLHHHSIDSANAESKFNQNSEENSFFKPDILPSYSNNEQLKRRSTLFGSCLFD